MQPAIRLIILGARPRIELLGLTVEENAVGGTVIGDLTVLHGKGTYTFTITDNPDSKFAIDGDEFETAAAIDYETATSHQVTVQADNGVDAPISRTFTITVIDVVAEYSTEAQQFFDRITDPGTTRKNLYATLIDGLVTDGIWTQIDVLKIYAADIQGNALINLKSASFPSVISGAPTFTADQGFLGDGIDDHLASGFNPTSAGGNWVQDAASFWMYALTNAQFTTTVVGNQTAPRLTMIPFNTSNQMEARLNDNTADVRANLNGNGFFGVQRTAAATKQLWENGVQNGADFATASTGLPNAELWELGSNTGVHNAVEIAAVLYGGSMAGKESALNGHIVTFLTAVGAI